MRDETKLTIEAVKELQYSRELRKKLSELDQTQGQDMRIRSIISKASSKHLIILSLILFMRSHEKKDGV